jgi:CBS domain-containing protein
VQSYEPYELQLKKGKTNELINWRTEKMLVSDLIKEKGAGVITTKPATTVSEVADIIASKRIGALVVTGPDGKVVGIISERDIVNGLSKSGANLLKLPVSDVMTRDVFTCAMTEDVNQLRREMVTRRARHIPIVEDDKPIGIISMGDIVKNRLDELEDETQQMRDYIATS